MKRKNNSLTAGGFAHPEISPEAILVQHKTEPRVDSRLFAKRIGIKHKNLFELIKKNAKSLWQFGTFPFKTERLNTEQFATLMSPAGYIGG
ncbi:hypothetical protein [Morganella morganii]|uniref:hypothetical protein n=1 Tax=Morganella morganii TaxID=582 RepID=UPI0021D27504|nr:hypothetical protein [Morganella morganii]MCU6224604.1 hypothetical protein [Morganella morganii]MCU6232414.1 hypothetical protein [Morganella morganii]